MPLPPGPSPPADLITAEQWRTLAALADAVVPALSPAIGADQSASLPITSEEHEALSSTVTRYADVSSPSDGRVAAFLAETATTQPEFKSLVLQTIGLYVDPDKRTQLLGLLDSLNNRAWCLFLTGHMTPLHELSIAEREAVLHGWRTSRLRALRDAFTSITSLIKLVWLRTSPSLSQVLGFPLSPRDKGKSPGFPFEFVQFPASDEPATIETDVVIVGSGCGGAVAAKVLSEAGLRVVVVDKGYFWPLDQLPMSEAEAGAHLYDNGGMFSADGGNVIIVAGSTWGGGGTVNWSASLIPQGFVRREWADKFGLPYFTSARFGADLDAVCERMGVSTAAIEHNKGNVALLEGSRRLGWNAKAVPQNTGGHKHYDGLCTLGCATGEKQGPTSTFLPDAAKTGAIFIEGLEVSKILFDSKKSASGDKVASGISGIWTSRDDGSGAQRIRRKVTIRASTVISSAGSLRTPALLRRSGLDNWHIGRHLHLHPVSFVGAVWDEVVNPWEGGILTSVVNDTENLDGDGYGAKLEAVAMLPSWYIGLFPWLGGKTFKSHAAKMRHSTGYISLARDRYGGRVTPDPSDPSRSKITYTPHAVDREHILAGTVALAQILYVAGAREVITNIPNVPSFSRSDSSSSPPSLNDESFKTWLQTLRSADLPAESTFASAHQMGSCRMGTAPRNSAVDPKGRVWGTEGLYVCDASVFPSASGVNPMITVMAIARGIARGIAEGVRRPSARL